MRLLCSSIESLQDDLPLFWREKTFFMKSRMTSWSILRITHMKNIDWKWHLELQQMIHAISHFVFTDKWTESVIIDAIYIDRFQYIFLRPPVGLNEDDWNWISWAVLNFFGWCTIQSFQNHPASSIFERGNKNLSIGIQRKY